jgi:hypothetical protein
MKAFKIIFIRDGKSGLWTAYLESIPGLIVQVKNREDAPKKLAKAMKSLMKHAYDRNIFEVYNFPI